MSINDFDHIIKEKLSNVAATPPPSILEGLQFDRVLNQKLSGAEAIPPPHIWDKIAAVVLPAAKPLFTPWKIAATIAVFVSMVGLMFLVNQDSTGTDNQLAQKQNSTYVEQVTNANMDSPKTTSESNPSSSDDIMDSEPNNIQETNSPIVANEPSSSDVTTSSTPNFETDNSTVASHSESTSNTTDNEIIEETIPQSLRSILQTSNSSEEVQLAKTIDTPVNMENSIEVSQNTSARNTVDTIQINTKEDIAQEASETIDNTLPTENPGPTNVDGKIPGTIKPNTRNLSQYAFSLRYSPEFMNVQGIESYRHGLDFGFNFQNRVFILETGIGGQYTSQTNVYELAYTDNFIPIAPQWIWDDLQFENGPQLDSSTGHWMDAYDSDDFTYSANARENFVNIRVPLLIGYQKDFRDYSLFAKGGIMYNLNIYQTTTNIEIPDNVSEIRSLNYQYQTIYKSQLEYMVAIGGNIDLTKNLKMTGEFTGRYSHYNYYLNRPGRGFGLGIRFGLLYEL